MVALKNSLAFASGPRVPNISEAERALVVRLRARDPAAFRTFFAEWRLFVYRVAVAIVRDPTEAEDVTQEVFFNASKAMRRFESKATLKTWLFRITRNAAITRLRTLQSQGNGRHDPIDEFVSEGRGRPLPSRGPSPEEHLLACERGRLADRAVGQLSELDRAMIRLRCVEGFSDKQIGLVLGLTWDQTRVRFFRMRHQLARFADSAASHGTAGALVLAVVVLPCLVEGISRYFNRSGTQEFSVNNSRHFW